MRKRKITSNTAVNETPMAGMPQPGSRGADREPFVVAPGPHGLRPDIAPDKISQYADEIYDLEKLEKSAR